MSSLYYANALFSKYQTATSVFPSGVFPEQTSCSFASSSSQRTGYGTGSTGTFPGTVPGLYTNGGTMHPQTPAMYPPSGYGLEAASFNMHCSPFEQNLSLMCSTDTTKQNCTKSEQRDTDLQSDTNLRIYPWMRSSTGKMGGSLFFFTAQWLAPYKSFILWGGGSIELAWRFRGAGTLLRVLLLALGKFDKKTSVHHKTRAKQLCK